MGTPFDKIAECGRNLPLIGNMFHKGPKVTVVRLSGVIAETARMRTNLNYGKLVAPIKKAFNKADTAVAFIINSPGGSASQSALITDTIRQFSEETKLPVYCFIEDVAASGGYWLACAGDEVYAQPVSIVGSIGVVSAGFGLDELISRHGVTRRIYTSGEYKAFLDPFRPEDQKDVERLKELQREIHDEFITWVKSRRKDKLKGTDKELFEGQFWTGKTAFDKGLIDGLGDVRSVMKEKFGMDTRLIVIEPEKKKFLPSLFSMGMGAQVLPEIRWADDLADTIESRSLWARYGL